MLIYAQVLPAAQRRTRRQWWHKQLRVPVFSWTGQMLYKSATKFKKKVNGGRGSGTPSPTTKLWKDNKFPVSSGLFKWDLQHHSQCMQESGSHYRHCPLIIGLDPLKPSLLVENELCNCNIPFLWNDQKKRFFRDRKQVSGCRRLAVKVGIKCKQAKGTFRGVMGNVLELDCSRGPTPLWIY